MEWNSAVCVMKLRDNYVKVFFLDIIYKAKEKVFFFATVRKHWKERLIRNKSDPYVADPAAIINRLADSYKKRYGSSSGEKKMWNKFEFPWKSA